MSTQNVVEQLPPQQVVREAKRFSQSILFIYIQLWVVLRNSLNPPQKEPTLDIQLKVHIFSSQIKTMILDTQLIEITTSIKFSTTQKKLISTKEINSRTPSLVSNRKQIITRWSSRKRDKNRQRCLRSIQPKPTRSTYKSKGIKNMTRMMKRSNSENNYRSFMRNKSKEKVFETIGKSKSQPATKMLCVELTRFTNKMSYTP